MILLQAERFLEKHEELWKKIVTALCLDKVDGKIIRRVDCDDPHCGCPDKDELPNDSDYEKRKKAVGILESTDCLPITYIRGRGFESGAASIKTATMFNINHYHRLKRIFTHSTT